MINDEMNNLLKQSKLYVDVIELDSKDTITDNFKVVHDRLKLNKNISSTTDNEEVINMVKQTKLDLNYVHLIELKSTLIQF